jgi:hypothetical protein
MRLTPFEFLSKLQVEGIAFLSECFARPTGYLVLVEIDYPFELPFDLGLGQTCVLVWLLVAGIGPVVVSVLSVKVPDKDVCEISWSPVSGLEPVDVVMGDESAVESEKVIQLLSHAVDVSALDHLFEISNDGDCHGLILRSLTLPSLRHLLRCLLVLFDLGQECYAFLKLPVVSE